MKILLTFHLFLLPLIFFGQSDSSVIKILLRTNDSIKNIENISYSSYVRYKTRTSEKYFGDKFADCWMQHISNDFLFGYYWRIDEHGSGREGVQHFYNSDSILTLWNNNKIIEFVNPDNKGNYTLFMEEQFSFKELYFGIPLTLKELNFMIPTSAKNFVRRDSLKIIHATEDNPNKDYYWMIELTFTEDIHIKEEKDELISVKQILWINKSTYLPERKIEYATVYWGSIPYTSIYEITASNFRINQEEIKKRLKIKIPNDFKWYDGKK